jgi:hypothetical protein
MPDIRRQSRSRSAEARHGAEHAKAEAIAAAVGDIASNKLDRLMGSADAAARPGLLNIYAAATGREGEKARDPAARLALLESGLKSAATSIRFMEREDPAWTAKYVSGPVGRLRLDLEYLHASGRVEGSVVLSGTVVETDTASPREQARILSEQIRKLVPATVMLNEQVIRAGESLIEKEAEQLMEGHRLRGSGLGTMAAIHGHLMLIDGFLTLTDEELHEHLREVHGLLPGVKSYAELVKGAIELVGGCTVATAAFAYGVAKVSGQHSLAAQSLGLAQRSALTLSSAVTAIELVVNLAILFDPKASQEERADASVGVLTGSLALAGTIAKGKLPWAGPLSVAIQGGYLYMKFAINTYWAANLAITGGWMSAAFRSIEASGQSIAGQGDELYRCAELLARERDPRQLEALSRVQANLAARLGRSIDDFISDCQPVGYAVGAAKYPGAYPVLREVFDPIRGLTGLSKPPDVVAAAARVLDRMAFAINHAQDLVAASALKQTFADFAAEKEAREAEQKNDGAGKEH